MTIIVMLVILSTPCLIAWMFHTRHARNRWPTPAQPQPPVRTKRPAYTEPPSKAETHTASPDGSAWSALDDRQLTRLLIDSAPRTTTE